MSHHLSLPTIYSQLWGEFSANPAADIAFSQAPLSYPLRSDMTYRSARLASTDGGKRDCFGKTPGAAEYKNTNR